MLHELHFAISILELLRRQGTEQAAVQDERAVVHQRCKWEVGKEGDDVLVQLLQAVQLLSDRKMTAHHNEQM